MSLLAFMLAAAVMDGAATAEPSASEPAAVPEAAATPDPAAVVSKEPGLICKREQVTGSRFFTKVCMTKEQAEERRQRDREMLEKMQTPMHGPT